MPPPSSPAPSSLPAGSTRAGRRLREVTGGYDLDPLPIRVAVGDGESVVSWLRRVSWRYDVPARSLMRDAGTSKTLSGTSKVEPRLRNNRQLLARLGLPVEDVALLLKPGPLTAATAGYVKAFHRAPPVVRPWSRYCPACLSQPDPYWRQDWQNPLSAVCPEHRGYLLQACPGCLQRPHQNPAWLSRPIELWRCPSALVTLGGSPAARSRRPWCTRDLRDADHVPARAEDVAAQQLLLGWAEDLTGPFSACGVTVTGRIGFDAFVDLIDADTPSRTTLDLAHDPVHVAARLADAAHVLTRPDLDQAAAAAARLLSYTGPHAPIGPVTRIVAAPYNPLLGAVQLHGVRDQLSTADQLMFRTGHPEPRYPATLTPDNRPRLRLPGHRPHLPDLDTQRLPQLIWPELLPDSLAGQPPGSDRPLRRAVLAMALAKVGSTRTWAQIAADLDLPPSTATNVGAVLQRIRRAGRWPATLATLDALATRLQAKPGPVEYAARRQAASDVHRLRDALAGAAHTHPTTTPADVVLRHFWELFTGGDVAYAPAPLHIAAHTARYRRYRATAAATLDQDRALLHTASHELGRLAGALFDGQFGGRLGGPLTWTPVEPAAIYEDDSVRLILGQTTPRTSATSAPF